MEGFVNTDRTSIHFICEVANENERKEQRLLSSTTNAEDATLCKSVTECQTHVVTNSATISAMDELIRLNRRITTREIAVELSISKGTVHHIIHKTLGYGKVCAQWVPKHLSENQKTARMGVCLT
ncbi:hypothetical protein AVEN_130416-1 [Araneus ventricosus]|uniref:Uncharacterized protein n=1 Tax=Araneus ventricosus TaxID=182803 RepID=A0A4Y2BDP4_ARAVE|nr:hypothetical protein AVEN_130416-1 [Araneus ventricosus]